MALIDVAKRAEKLITDNSPTILTVLGVTGTLATAYLAGTASFKAANIIADEQYRLVHTQDPPPFLLKEQALFVWKLYIPAAGTAVVTVVCIIGANHIGSRRAAAVAAAYSISEKAFSEYKEKVVEKVGIAKEQKVRDELAQERADNNPASTNEVIITGNGEVLCFDEFSARYFKSDMETLKKAQNDINYQIIAEDYASLGDFYGKIDLPTTSYSEEVGWTVEKKLELRFSTIMSDDQRPCISIGFQVAPVRNYYRQH